MHRFSGFGEPGFPKNVQGVGLAAPDLEQALSSFSLASDGRDALYVTGGSTSAVEEDGRYGSAQTNTVWKYSISKDAWTSEPAMNFARRWHGSAVAGQHLYVLGGVGLRNSGVIGMRTKNGGLHVHGRVT